MKDDAVYLRHILECIRRIEEDITNGKAQFLSIHTYQDAVLRNLQTMAESTQRLSNDLKGRYAEVSWTNIAGFRNVLVHNYLGIDLDSVWEITQQDVPQLKRVVSNMLGELEA